MNRTVRRGRQLIDLEVFPAASLVNDSLLQPLRHWSGAGVTVREGRERRIGESPINRGGLRIAQKEW